MSFRLLAEQTAVYALEIMERDKKIVKLEKKIKRLKEEIRKFKKI